MNKNGETRRYVSLSLGLGVELMDEVSAGCGLDPNPDGELRLFDSNVPVSVKSKNISRGEGGRGRCARLDGDPRLTLHFMCGSRFSGS